MRYRITLSYDGSQFNGWQVQDNAPSVQESLQEALSILFKEEISVTGAGRTDTLVNAAGYVAHFDARPLTEPEAGQLGYKLNAILPPSVTVHSIVPESDDFHARFDAVKREYCYFLHRKKDPFISARSLYKPQKLDVEKMNEAAALLVGRKDFSCFEKTGGNNKTSFCTVYSAAWEEYVPTHVSLMGYPASPGDYLVFRISADRFLRNMVRAVVGTLLEIGLGKHGPEWMLSVLESGDRGSAGESVPGNALFLSRIEY